MIENRNVFVFFTSMINRIVDDIDENLKTEKYDVVRLFCKKNRSLTINNVFYVKKCFYNFLSFNQFQFDDCFLFIIQHEFVIDSNDIEIIFRCDLYFVQLKNFVVCIFVNFDTFRMWHKRFEHLNDQNVINLIRNVNINLFKFFSKNFCFFCDKKIDKTKSHKNRIASNRHQINFIHENLINSFFVRNYNNVFYVIV